MSLIRVEQTLLGRCEELAPETGVPSSCEGLLPGRIARSLTVARPRLGLALRAGERHVLRLAYQDWVRPAADGTLSPVATAGIPLDDRIVASGGRLRRLRMQLESTATERLFLQVHGDYQEIANTVIEGLPGEQVTSNNLDTLRRRTLENPAGFDPLEGTPYFDRGKLLNFGIAANGILTRRLSAYLRGEWTDSELTDLPIKGVPIPLVAEKTASVGATWVSPTRLYVSGRAIWRGDRLLGLDGQLNQHRLPAGWAADLLGYRESPDKRWVVQAGIFEMLNDQAHTTYGFQLIYRP